MNYLTHWLTLWPTSDKPEALFAPDRGVLWRNEWEPCHDHLEGLMAICKRCMPVNEWEGKARWEKYYNQLSEYMKPADRKILAEMIKAGTWSGRIVQTVKKPVAETPIFAAIENEKQLTIFNK